MSTPGKSLLRTLEDEAAELSRTCSELQQEVDALRKRGEHQDTECMTAVSRAEAAEEAASQMKHILRMEQASTSALTHANARLEDELKIAKREIQGLVSACDRQRTQLGEALEQNTAMLQEAEELRTTVRTREEAVGYESARGAALEGGVDALASRLRSVEMNNEARVAEWLTERRRMQEGWPPSQSR